MADLFFALHALAAVIFTAIQGCIYPSGKNNLSKKTIIFLWVQWIFIIAYALLLRVYLYL